MTEQRLLAVRVKAVLENGESRPITKLMKSLRAKRADLEDCVGDIEGLYLIVAMSTQSGYYDLMPTEYEIQRDEWVEDLS